MANKNPANAGFFVFSPPIQRTHDPGETLPEYVGIDLGGIQITMAKQLLDRANIGTVEQQLCGKRVAEGMGGRRLVDPRIKNGLANRLLNSRYMDVMTYPVPRSVLANA